MVGLQGQEELVKRKFNGGQSRRNFERENHQPRHTSTSNNPISRELTRSTKSRVWLVEDLILLDTKNSIGPALHMSNQERARQSE
jgi:hypothetical protein